MSLNLTDKDVDDLISLSKMLLKKHEINVSTPNKGTIPINSLESTDKFCLDYFARPGKASLNYREMTYNYSLIRINLNKGFHKNADNVKVEGNRINVFSNTEFQDKADLKTHTKSYPLPYLGFDDTSDVEVQLIKLLEYTNTNYHNKLNISSNLV